jgi:hypothetical protein
MGEFRPKSDCTQRLRHGSRLGRGKVVHEAGVGELAQQIPRYAAALTEDRL